MIALVAALLLGQLAPDEPTGRGFDVAVPRAARRTPPPIGTFLAEGLVSASFGPSELTVQARLGYRLPIFTSAERWLSHSELAIGIAPRVSARGFAVGPFLEVAPSAFFRLRASAELVQNFGWLDATTSYRSPSLDYWQAGEPYRSGGGHIQLEPTLHARLGPVAVKNRFSADFWNMAVRLDDRVFYEPTADTLVPRKGWVLSNSFDVTYEVSERLTAGVRYVVTGPVYDRDDFPRTGAGSNVSLAQNGHQRLGAIASFVPWSFSVLGTRPILVGDVGFWLAHRYRAGAERFPLIPRLWIGAVIPLTDPIPAPK